MLHGREAKASSALRAGREREIAELRAVLRLQVAVRRLTLTPTANPNSDGEP